jgi:hypothetical protein
MLFAVEIYGEKRAEEACHEGSPLAYCPRAYPFDKILAR